MTRNDRIRHGGSVRRYHTQRTIGHQTVAEHSWGVACILLEICSPSPMLMAAALYHDVAEGTVGDMPATAKWANPALKAAMDAAEMKVEHELGISTVLTEDERKMLKLADLLELMWYCLDQRRMGNRELDRVWHNGMSALVPLMDDPLAATAAEMLEELADHYHRAEYP